jgi:hypothetical protein
MNLVKKLTKLLPVIIINALTHINNASAQSCSGHWVNNYPYTFQCISGQVIGGWPPTGDPSGCPVNPIFVGRQTNTFIFDNTINNFAIDFNAFNSIDVGCARMQVKINNIFYPLSPTNLIELPTSDVCSGTTSILTITSDGYLTNNSNIPTNNGQGRLIFTGVNATSVTFSTNDGGGGTVFTNPCMTVVMPIKLKSFTYKETGNCKIILNWQSEIESNAKIIQVLRSEDNNNFKILFDVAPKGSYSNYELEVNSSTNAFFKLKLIDFDGRFEFSKTINVKPNCNKQNYQVYPNPTSNFLQVVGFDKASRILIFDAVGRTVITENKFQNNKIDVENLSTGIYLLRVIRNGIIEANIKFVKN